MRVLHGVVIGNVQLHLPVVGVALFLHYVVLASFSAKLVWLSVVEIEGRSIKFLGIHWTYWNGHYTSSFHAQ